MMRLLHLARNHWDRTAALACAVGAGVALLVAWIGVSDTVFTFEQIPFLVSGGLLGVCLVAAAAALWVSADLRDEWRKLDDLEDAVRTLTASGATEIALVMPEEQDERRSEAAQA